MNNITVLGRNEYEKTQLLLYISKLLVVTKEEKVIIATSNPYFKGEYNPWEYEDQITIFNFTRAQEIEQLVYANADTIIFDIECIDPKQISEGLFQNSKMFLFTKQTKESIEYNKQILKIFDVQEVNMTALGYKINALSKINQNTLSEIYEISTEDILIYFENQKDAAIIIDNSHNNCIRFNKLSREYKNFLAEILAQITNEYDKNDVKKIKELKKIMGRVK